LKKTAPPAAVHCRVELADLNAHLYRVTLTIAEPAADQRVSLPVWIPGSYLVREFARHLQHLTARQGSRKPAVTQLDKCSWQVAARAGQPLTLSYEVYAFDNSVRTAWLDSSRGFFNATSLCLRAEGHEDAPHTLEVLPSKAVPGWSLATGLAPVKANRRGFGTYRAAGYDELADSPVEMGTFWSGSFTACGVPHRFVVAGAPAAFDSERLLADTKKICEAEIRFWHGEPGAGPGSRKRAGGRSVAGQPPFTNYLFMLNAVDDGYGGLEHRNSTALICTRKDLPRLGEVKAGEGYTTLLGLISHEYFHTWNVKRLRPAEFARYDYTQENYTALLWFFEGFTSYYDDLLLRRAGLLDDAGYLKLLNKTINQVLQAPGREVQSVAQASFDAWVKYYRQDENTANATISYYTKGALVALCFDLTLRSGATPGATLDNVMRTLWQRSGGGPMSEADFADALKAVGRRPFTPELAAWVHSTQELPLRELLSLHGVAVLDDPAQLAQRLGLRVSEANGIQVKTVLRGGAAETAGIAAGDEWLGVEVGQQAWRLNKLDELPLYAGRAPRITALVARDKRLLRLPLKLPPAATTWRLAVRDAAKVSAWLAPGDPPKV
jgi:predicted metalloprotease with PDZ domain